MCSSLLLYFFFYACQLVVIVPLEGRGGSTAAYFEEHCGGIARPWYCTHFFPHIVIYPSIYLFIYIDLISILSIFLSPFFYLSAFYLSNAIYLCDLLVFFNWGFFLSSFSLLASFFLSCFERLISRTHLLYSLSLPLASEWQVWSHLKGNGNGLWYVTAL